MTPTLGIAGGTGFIGATCMQSLGKWWRVRSVPAPRFATAARSMDELRSTIDMAQVEHFAEHSLHGVDVLVNAAGLPTATSADLSAMLGANAQLPLFLARAARIAGVQRMVHLSSAAVQGRMTLDESDVLRPESLYALSKALAERLLRAEEDCDIVLYRPTSVQGALRSVTRSLARLAQSQSATVAAPGDDPSPQTSVARVAQAIGVLSDLALDPSPVVLHPWEGTTTRSVLADLGGKDPRIVNRTVAATAVNAAYAAAHLSDRLRGHARRLDMVLFGQAQETGWLDSRLGPVDDDWLRRVRQDLLLAREGART